jgi:transcriptional regulator with XRE-family HTH domain
MGFQENLRSELAYSGMPVKELAALSGVKKYSIDSYLSKRDKTPSVESAVKIAKALGVSVEYLVTGEENKQKDVDLRISHETRAIALLSEQLDKKKRKFALDFMKWLQNRDVTDL